MPVKRAPRTTTLLNLHIPPAAHTGTTAETILAQCTLAANALGLAKVLRSFMFGTQTGNTNTKTWRIRLGGLTGEILASAAPNAAVATVASLEVTTMNKSTAAAQSNMCRGTRPQDTLIQASLANTTVDTTVEQTIVITGQLANGADAMTLTGALIELVDAAI